MFVKKIIGLFCCLALFLGVPSCSEDEAGSGSSMIAVKGVALSVEDVAFITVTVSGPGIDPAIVVELTQDPELGWTGLIENIPAGEERVFVAG